MSDNFNQAKNHILSEEAIQARYLYGLSLLSRENLAEFQKIWPGIALKRRAQIMTSLVEITEYSFEVDFEPIFILGLNDPDPDIQVRAIDGLWEEASPALIPPLVHLLKTGQTVAVRAKAASSLGQFVHQGELEEIDETAYEITYQALLSTIRQADEDVEVLRRAIEAISFSSHKGIPQIIENAYYHEEPMMQVSAVFAMGRHGNRKRWGKLVLTELHNHDAKIRFEAVRAAGELQLTEAVAKLIELLEQEADTEIQQSVVWSLGQIGGPEAKAVIEQLLEDEDEALQQVAEDALDEIALWGDDLDEFFSYTLGQDDEDDIHIIDLNGH